MQRYLTLCALTIGGIFLSQHSWAVDFSADTSIGGSTFSQMLGADGEYTEGRRLRRFYPDGKTKGIWNAEYTFTKTTTTNAQGAAVVDNTNGIDVGIGTKRKKVFEYGLGFTYANTPEENLKDYGPDIYYGRTFLLDQPSKENFVPSLSFKLTLTEIVYYQTFDSTTTTRLGKQKPTTGISGISQFAPKLEATMDFWDPLSIKLAYTYFFYNRNVPDFVATLDSPQSVNAGIYGLTNAVSSFFINEEEEDIYWYPLDPLEFDFEGTQGNSAVDGTLTWTVKGGFLYEFAKDWKGGLAVQYVSSSTLTDHVYTLSFKYEPD